MFMIMSHCVKAYWTTLVELVKPPIARNFIGSDEEINVNNEFGNLYSGIKNISLSFNLLLVRLLL